MRSQHLANVLQQLGDCGLGTPSTRRGRPQRLARFRARPTARGARADAPAPAAPAPTAGLHGTIARWSVQVNRPDWNQNLGVTDTRQQCSSSPMDCVNLVRKVAQTSNVRATLVVPLNGTTIVADALQFSELSLNAPFLVEVRID